MKLEIEITEDEIRSAIERKVRVAIADLSDSWSIDSYIKDVVGKSWKAACDEMVREQLADSEDIRSRIRSVIEAKLKAQIAAMMKSEIAKASK